jgi:predicted acetyltransferase
MTARDAIWWNRRYDDKRENGPQFYVLYEEDGRCEGYLLYRVKGDWTDGVHGSEATVIELIATSVAAEAALWEFVFSLDLIKTVRVYARPVDDAVHHMLADPRRLKRSPRDAIWLRLVDAVPALEARTYAPGRLVVELRDEFCPWNTGRYALESDGRTASCGRTTADADVVIPTASLATAYFGGTRLSALARAGRADERTPGALRKADAMFAPERAPWSPEHW